MKLMRYNKPRQSFLLFSIFHLNVSILGNGSSGDGRVTELFKKIDANVG